MSLAEVWVNVMIAGPAVLTGSVDALWISGCVSFSWTRGILVGQREEILINQKKKRKQGKKAQMNVAQHFSWAL